MIEVTVKQTEPITVAFVRMRGSYAQMPQALGRAYGTATAAGLMPVGMPHGVYFTAPGEVSEDEALWEVWAPVAGTPSPSGPDEEGFGIKQVPGKLVASAMHVGPYETIEPTYRELGKWVAEQGYQLAGPPEEIYFSDPNELPPEEYVTEIQFPVTKP